MPIAPKPAAAKPAPPAYAAKPGRTFPTAKVALTAASLAFVLLASLGIYWIVTHGSGDAAKVEAEVWRLIEEGKHAEAYRAIEAAKLPEAISQKLNDENAKKWLARAESQYSQQRYEAAQDAAKAILAAYPENDQGKNLYERAGRKVELANLKREAEKAIDDQRWSEAKRLINELDQLPEGRPIASLLRPRLPPVESVDVAALELDLRTKKLSEVRDTINKILQSDPKHPEARLHRDVIDAIAEMDKGIAPTTPMAGWIRDLIKSGAAVRLEELLTAVTDLADRKPEFARRAAKGLPGPEESPPDVRPYLHYLRALAEAGDNKLASAADELSKALAAPEAARPKVLHLPERRKRAAGVLVSAAEQSRQRGQLTDPFRNNQKAHHWLWNAYLLGEKPQDEASVPLRFNLVLAAAHLPKPDRVLVRSLCAELLRDRDKKVMADLLDADGAAFFLAYAQSQDTGDPAANAGALVSYAEVLERLSSSQGAGRIGDDALYAYVLKPAVEISQQVVGPERSESLRKQMAGLLLAYGRLLRSNLDQKWHGLTEEDARRKAVEAYDRAAELQPLPENIAERIEAYLDLAAGGAWDALLKDARDLYTRRPKIPLKTYRLLAKLLLLQARADSSDTRKDIDRFTEALARCEEGLAAVRREGGHGEEEARLGKLRSELTEELKTSLRSALRSAQQRADTAATKEFAAKLQPFEPVEAALYLGPILYQEKKYDEALACYAGALAAARERGNLFHLRLRLAHVALLYSGLVEVSDPLEIVRYADEALALAIEPLDHMEIGSAHAVAGVARWRILDTPAAKPKRNDLRLQALKELETAFALARSHRDGASWRWVYAKLVESLLADDPNHADLARYRKEAILRIDQALNPKTIGSQPPAPTMEAELKELRKKLAP